MREKKSIRLQIEHLICKGRDTSTNSVCDVEWSITELHNYGK